MIQIESKETDLRKILRVVVTPECNLNCPFCHNEGMSEKDFYPEVSLEKSLQLVQLFREFGVVGVSLTGGEPLLYRHFPRLATEICQLYDSLYVHLTTNGVFLLEYSNLIKSLRLGQVNISIPSIDQGKYAKITGYDTLFQVLRGVDKIISDTDSKVHINVVMVGGINDSEKDLLSLLDYWQEKPVKLDLIIPYRWPQRIPQPQTIVAQTIRDRLEHIGAIRKTTSLGRFRGPNSKYEYKDMIFSLRVFAASKDHHLCKGCSERSICIEGISNPRISLSGVLKPCLLGPAIDLRYLVVENAWVIAQERIAVFFKNIYGNSSVYWEQR